MADRANIRAFVDRVRRASESAFTAQASIAEADLKASLGVPYPPSSAAGEPPHSRTGNLQDGATVTAFEDERGVGLRARSERVDGDERVPAWLEEGTRKMDPHPYMEPSRDRTGPAVHAAHADALRGLAK